MVDYLNAEQGGVDGSPIRAVVCTTDDTAAGASACAQRFATAADVHVVIESTTNPTAIADVLVPAGKPLIAGGVDFGNLLRRGVSVFEPGAAGIAHALFTYAVSNVSITHLTVFHADDPAMEGMKPVLDHIAAKVGITIDAYVPLGFTGDLTGPISEGVASSSDGLMFVVAPPQCAPAGAAVRSLGIELPVIVAELCLTDDIVASGMIDGWYAGTQSVAPVVNGGQEARLIRRILRTYGEGTELGGLAGLGVGYVSIARDVLVRAGGARATDASVTRVLSKYASSDVLGFDVVRCPGPGPFVAACNTSTLLVQADAGSLRDVGGFIRTDFMVFADLL
jgi:ABC-type branched-subunit amino acid transport system substrate-binding protein